MNVPRRTGHIEVTSPDGRVALLVHRTTPPASELVHVRISPFVTANWVRADCTFRYVPEKFLDKLLDTRAESV